MQRRDDPEDKEFIATLAKGLAVLGAFGRQRPAMTLSEVCRAEWSNVFPVPRILDFGFAYLSTQSWIDRALPLMREVSERLGESCSAAILQGMISSMSRACRRGASCRRRFRSAAGCRPFTQPWDESCSDFSMKPKSGGG